MKQKQHRIESVPPRYRFVAIDVDGTLLDSNKALSEANKTAIQEAVFCGVTVCICTGRPLQAVDRFSKLIGISNLPFILYNGAMVVSGNKRELLFEQGISESDASTLLTLGRQLGTTLIVWSKNRLYVNERNARVEHYCTITPIEPILIADYEALARQGITKMIWYDEPERMPLLMDALAAHPVHDHVNSFTSHPLFLELVDKQCSKALAIAKLISYLGIPQAETVAIGDGKNDIPMLQYAALGIAMGNASEKVKACADVVTDSNDNDGVAKALKKYVVS